MLIPEAWRYLVCKIVVFEYLIPMQRLRRIKHTLSELNENSGILWTMIDDLNSSFFNGMGRVSFEEYNIKLFHVLLTLSDCLLSKFGFASSFTVDSRRPIEHSSQASLAVRAIVDGTLRVDIRDKRYWCNMSNPFSISCNQRIPITRV